jgi:hypothetical protein
VWRVLARCHDIPNLGEYEGELDVNDRVLADLIVACRVVVAKRDQLPAIVAPDDRRRLVLQRVPTRCRIATTLVGDYGIAMLFIVLVLVG